MKSFYLAFILALFFSSCQEEKIVFVADHYGNCEEQCLLIRENKDASWDNFSGKIDGFKYEEGYSYQLKVLISKNKKGKGDDNDEFTYKLVKIISKIKTEEASSANIDDGKKWYVKQLAGFENTTDRTPFFTIKSGNINGNSGCNTFGGNLLLNDKGLFSVGRLRMTKMYCEKYMKLEIEFSQSLSKANLYTLANDELKVFDENEQLLFLATQKEPDVTIENTWYVTSIKGFHNKTYKTPHFTIKENQISGNNGCNSFGGSFLTDKNKKFETGLLRVTKMYCQETAELEKNFHRALSTIVSYKITEGALFLLDKSNYVVISATTDKSIITDFTTKYEPFIIEYNTFSEENTSIRNKITENKNLLEFYDSKPIKTDVQEKTLSKSELLFFKEELSKIDANSLESIKAPSIKHQTGEVAGATLIISFKGKTYRVPTFDHGNPPVEIKTIVEKIMELRLE